VNIEIWTDVMCPFCYIGKRKLEAALSEFVHADDITLVWRSYLLRPNLQTAPEKRLHHFLSTSKGLSLEQAQMLNARVSEMAARVGLRYRLDDAVLANTFDAHRLLQLAKQHGLGGAMEERLLGAYLCEGANVADRELLRALGVEVGLSENQIDAMLAGEQCASEVERDLREARALGVSGVPFFLFDRKYAVPGARDSEVFAQVLRKSFAEWRADGEALAPSSERALCTPEGECG